MNQKEVQMLSAQTQLLKVALCGLFRVYNALMPLKLLLAMGFNKCSKLAL